jgi:hypothetical protein
LFLHDYGERAASDDPVSKVTFLPLASTTNSGLGIAAEQPTHVADVVQQAGDDEVIVVGGFDPFRERYSQQDDASDR